MSPEGLIRLWENRELLRDFVEARGVWAPLVFVALQAAQVVLAPLPGEITGFLAGMLFGAWRGFLLAMAGLAAGSSAAFGLARIFRGPVKRRLAARAFYRKAEIFTRRHGAPAAFLLFLFPGFPKDYLCYVLGLLPMPFRVFFPVMLLGRAPATLALTLQGNAAFGGDWKTFFWVALAVLSALALLKALGPSTGEDTPDAS